MTEYFQNVIETLPALYDEQVWIGGGFNGIVEHLRKKSHGKWDLDWELLGQQHRWGRGPGGGYGGSGDEDEGLEKEGGEGHGINSGNTMHTAMSSRHTWAESVAYSSFIRSRLGPLVDISLYVSDANYANATRPEYSKKGMLPWPTQYYVPGKRRAQAWDRAVQVLAKYGLNPHEIDLRSMLDSKTSLDLKSNTASAGVDTSWTAVPGGLAESRVSSRGLSSVFGTRPPASTPGVVSKLQTLVSKSLRPVAAPLFATDSDSTLVYFFKRQHPTSVDCLILGYLCLAIYPEVPNYFLINGIQGLDGGDVGARILAWTHKFRGTVFGSLPIDGYKILNPETANGSSTAITSIAASNSITTDATNNDPTTGILPWKIERADLPGLTAYITSASQTYLESWLPMWTKKKAAPKQEEGEEEKEPKHRTTFSREKLEKIASVAVGTCAFLAFILSRATVSLVAIEYIEEEDGDEEKGGENSGEMAGGEAGEEEREEGEDREDGG